jgi:histone H3/H4
MRKKLDSRIPASRIKKIMQADEDVGKIALPVPLLVSKALELFLQNLCDRTCEITLQRGAKTISAAHLKQCVQRFNVFDFLQEIVNKVPDMRSSDALGEGRNGNRRRKALEEDESEEELKRARMVWTETEGNGRGHRRGRGRGRGARGSKSSGKTSSAPEKFEDEDLDLSPECSSDKQAETSERCADVTVEAREPTEKVVLDSTAPFVRDFDLNLDLDENGNVVSSQPNVKHLDAEVSQPNVKHLDAEVSQPNVKQLDAEVSQPIVKHMDAEVSQCDLKQEEIYPKWSHSNGYDVNIDRLYLQMYLDRNIDQDEDDYDNDDG